MEEEGRAKKEQELTEAYTSQQPHSSQMLGFDDNLESKVSENNTKIIRPNAGKLKLKKQKNDKFGQRIEHMVPKKKNWNEKNMQNDIYIHL